MPTTLPRSAVLALLLLGLTALPGVAHAHSAATDTEVRAEIPAPAAVPARGSVPAAATGPAPAAATVQPGWERFETSTSYAYRYVPASLAAAVARGEAVPAVVFLHGAGGRPENYRGFVAPAAESAGCVLVLPRSGGLGWGYAGDAAIVQESLRRAGEELVLDPTRTAVAGHSAGGAYAYLLAYRDGRPFSGVFSIAAPYQPVAALASGTAAAPIRMDYGSLDPHYAGGSAARLAAQWDRLGVAWQQHVHAGLGHGDLPPEAMADGLAFLVAQELAGSERCTPSDTAHCLQGGRFRVEVDWQTAAGGVGEGHVVPGTASADSGLFWFFRPDNWELLVKVLDGCAVNGRYWVFAAATTNVGHTLTVTDTATGAAWSHVNPVGRTAPAVTATNAFDSCD
ncbi:MAG TPA: hypothetical protein VHQ65_05490 [Thermoanaerobaculia bacterium]|nr:hypothetical protein [Thermoanaerobaculia bacterium]